MMKKDILLITILMIFCTAQLFPQGSGYMGKHVFINAEVINSPCYFNINHNGKKGYTAFDYILTPSIEYLIGDRISLGGSFMYHTSMYKRTISHYDFDGSEFFEYNANYKYTAMGGGLFFKLYWGGKKSVLGNHFRVEINILNINGEEKNELGNNYTSLMGGGRFEFGKDFLFFNRLKLNMGIGVGLLIGGNSDEWEYGFYSSGLDAGQRMFRNYFFGLRMGIGFLAF